MQRFNRFLYKAYASAYTTEGLKRIGFTRAGRIFFAALTAAAIFGLDTTKAAVYQLFALLAVLFAAAWAGTLFFRPQLTFKRSLPDCATAGQPVRYTIRLSNPGRKPLSGLLFQEEPSACMPTWPEFLECREPGEEQRNAWDRLIKLHRFDWLVQQKRRLHGACTPLPPVRAGGSVTARAEFTPHRRGYIELNRAAIRRDEPFGLLRASVRLHSPDRLLVLPRRYPLPAIRLPGSRKYNPGGISLASSVGNATEFRTLREYRPGDPIRMLHWKSIAKTGELIIRENEDEYFIRHGLILDTFCAPSRNAVFETAVSVAASFACSLGHSESMMDLMFIEDKAWCIPAGRGVDHTGRLLEVLACIGPCLEKPFDDLIGLVRSHAAVLSGCICILLDWNAERRDFISRLRAVCPALIVLVISETSPMPEAAEAGVHVIDISCPEKGLAVL